LLNDPFINPALNALHRLESHRLNAFSYQLLEIFFTKRETGPAGGCMNDLDIRGRGSQPRTVVLAVTQISVDEKFEGRVRQGPNSLITSAVEPLNRPSASRLTLFAT
jgi:hypothetical protein